MMIFLLLSSFLYSKESITIASNNYAPYTLINEIESGVILDIVKEVFIEVGLDLQIQKYPWKRAEASVLRGEIFAAAPYFKTEKRLSLYNFSEPLVYSFNRFFYNKKVFPEGFKWKNLRDFSKFQMGGVLGYWYLDSFDKAGLTTQLVPTDLQNLKKLVRNRIDFTVIDELTGLKLIKDNLIENIENIGMLEKEESFAPFYLLISKSYPNSLEITERFNRGLKIIRKNGKYLKILKKYNMPEHFSVD